MEAGTAAKAGTVPFKAVAVDGLGFKNGEVVGITPPNAPNPESNLPPKPVGCVVRLPKAPVVGFTAPEVEGAGVEDAPRPVVSCKVSAGFDGVVGLSLSSGSALEANAEDQLVVLIFGLGVAVSSEEGFAIASADPKDALFAANAAKPPVVGAVAVEKADLVALLPKAEVPKDD